ncbi:LysR family transcriptional regulator [Bacillus subtilis subsp. subtilis]|nr:LysR family transcriptional regulator [Bacillus subtilis subsp. subtilis]
MDTIEKGDTSMRYGPESLHAFVEAAALGSFSAAARRLKKTQSTISTAVATLEADLGLTLFDRSGRYPVLTEDGRKVLGHVQEILAAAERLEQLSIRLADAVEPRLCLVVSDIYQLNPDQHLLRRFEQRFPDIELEWLDAEGDDVLEVVQRGRAHLGLLPQQPHYPSELAVRTLPLRAEMAVFVAREHPLAQSAGADDAHLARHRRICLSGDAQRSGPARGHSWLASDYLMVLEMAEDGFGWAELPRDLVARYGRGLLVELPLPGWPRLVASDAVWRNDTALGPAALWLLDQFLQAAHRG